MSNRVIAAGSDFMVFIESGQSGSLTYRPIAGQSNVSLERGANYRETSNKNLGGYKDFFQGLKDWTASVDMDIPDQSDVNADEVSYEELQDIEDAGEKPIFVFAWVKFEDGEPVVDTTKRMYRGAGLVSCPFSGAAGENATTSIAIQGCRQLEIVSPV